MMYNENSYKGFLMARFIHDHAFKTSIRVMISPPRRAISDITESLSSLAAPASVWVGKVGNLSLVVHDCDLVDGEKSPAIVEPFRPFRKNMIWGEYTAYQGRCQIHSACRRRESSPEDHGISGFREWTGRRSFSADGARSHNHRTAV